MVHPALAYRAGAEPFGGGTRGPSSRPRTPTPFPLLCSWGGSLRRIGVSTSEEQALSFQCMHQRIQSRVELGTQDPDEPSLARSERHVVILRQYVSSTFADANVPETHILRKRARQWKSRASL